MTTAAMHEPFRGKPLLLFLPLVIFAAGSLAAYLYFNRDPLTAARLAAIRGRDVEARKAAVADLLARGRRGTAALKTVFGGDPPDIQTVLRPGRGTFHAGERATFKFGIQNRGRKGGWAPPLDSYSSMAAEGGRYSIAVEEFGAPIAFPEFTGRRSGGGRKRAGIRGGGLWRFVGALEWLEPGAVATGMLSYEINVPDAVGIATVSFEWSFRRELFFPDLPDPIAVACPDKVSGKMTFFVLPPAERAGAMTRGARLKATVRGREVEAVLTGDGKCLAPADFGSTWFVAMDGTGEVIAHGALGGGAGEARTYGYKDLVPPPPEPGLRRAFPLPDLPPGAATILIGVRLLDPDKKDEFDACSEYVSAGGQADAAPPAP